MGFLAGDVETAPKDLVLLKEKVEQAFQWDHRVSSPFVAVFSGKLHAENWALRCGNGSLVEQLVYTIRAANLGDTTVFKLSHLVQSFRIHPRDGAKQHIKGAYLCLHRIPALAISGSYTALTIEEGMYSVLFA